MKPVYMRKDDKDITRKVLMDMAYLSAHKKIRLLKWLYEDGLYFNYMNKTGVDKFFLTRDKIRKEDEYHYFFEFPFKDGQVEDVPGNDL